MENRKIWEIYLSLSPHEVKKIPIWLELMTKGGNRTLFQLAKIMADSYPEAPREEFVCEAIFSEMSYELAKHRLTTTCTRLQEQVGNYLAMTQLLKNEHARDLFLLEGLSDRRAFGFLDYFARKVSLAVNKTGILNTQLAQKAYHLAYFIRKKKLVRKTNVQDLMEVSNLQDLWLIHEKLSNIMVRLGNSRATDKEDELSDLDKQVIKEARNFENALEYPALPLFLGIIDLLAGRREDYFLLFDILKTKVNSLSIEETKNCYALLLNYCIRKYNKEADELTSLDLIGIYTWGIDSSLLLTGKFLAPMNIKNILMIYLRANKLEAAKEFLDIYLHRVAPSERKETQILGEALIAFEKNEYEKVYRAISENKFKDYYLETQARIIMLESQYKLPDMQQDYLLPQIENSIRFVKNNMKNPGQIGNLNRLQMLKKLVLSFGKTKRLQKLKATIEQKRSLNNRDWLLKEINSQLHFQSHTRGT